MLQSVVIGSGAIQAAVWIPEVGVAACSTRSKVCLTLSFELRMAASMERDGRYKRSPLQRAQMCSLPTCLSNNGYRWKSWFKGQSLT